MLGDPEVTIPNQTYHDQVQAMTAETEEVPHPPQDDALEELTKRIWNQTQEVHSHDVAVARFRADSSRILPGRKSQRELLEPDEKSGATIRVHDEALIYRNTETMVAMTVPADHKVNYKPAEQVKQPQDRNTEVGEDPRARQFADTMRLVADMYTREVNIQEILEAYAQDATIFNWATLKITWRIDYQQSAPEDGVGPDQQDNAARLRSILEDAALGRSSTDKPALIEALQQMQQMAGETSEIEIWSGLQLRLIPRWAFRIDGNVRDITRIYYAGWMSDDVLMTRRSFKAKYPYKVLQSREDGTPEKWEGVHPSHIDGMTVYQEDDEGVPRPTRKDTLRHMRQDEYSRKGMSIDDELILVRTVYHRERGVVYTLVDGLSYPVKQVIPKKAPEQWYPYVIFSPNRIPEDVNGVSDVELQGHVVDRILRKATEEERARHNSLGRGVYDKAAIDPEDEEVIENIQPGEFRGIGLKSGKSINDVVKFLATPYQPEAFDRTEDKQTLRQLAVISEHQQGATGSANFASEVAAAQQGTAIAAGHRQDRYRRAIERIYDMIHELLLMYVPPDMAKRIAGPNALWPEVVTEAEAQQIAAEVKQLALQKAMVELMPVVEQDLQQSLANGAAFDPRAHLPALQEAAEAIGAQILQERYGHNEILTRETLYRQLKIEVSVSVNKLVDSNQRIGNAIRLLEVAGATGTMVDGRPFVKLAADNMKLSDDIAGSVQMDPNILLQQAVQSAANNPGSVSEESVRLIMGLGQTFTNMAVMSNPAAAQGVLEAAAGPEELNDGQQTKPQE